MLCAFGSSDIRSETPNPEPCYGAPVSVLVRKGLGSFGLSNRQGS